MKTLSYIIVSFIVGILCTSCSAKRDRYLPVFHSQPRISTLGFSISPPPGFNWYEKVSDGSIFYLKKIEPKNYFIYTKATELHFSKKFAGSDEFLKFVKEKKGLNTDPEVYKNSSADYKPSDEATICVKYRQQYEDHSLTSLKPQAPTDDIFANVISNGLICIHPDKPGIGIDIFYLERKMPGVPVVSYAEEGEKFLGSLSFVHNSKTL